MPHQKLFPIEIIFFMQIKYRLVTLIPNLLLQAEGRRILLFSQWTRLLDLLEVLLHDIGMTFLRLDGSTAVKVSSFWISNKTITRLCY